MIEGLHKIYQHLTANKQGSEIGARFALGFAAMCEMSMAPALVA